MTDISKDPALNALFFILSALSVTSLYFWFSTLYRLQRGVFDPIKTSKMPVNYGAHRGFKTAFGPTEARIGPINYDEGRRDGKIVKHA